MFNTRRFFPHSHNILNSILYNEPHIIDYRTLLRNINHRIHRHPPENENNNQENVLSIERNENIPFNPFLVSENNIECENEINYENGNIENNIYYLKNFDGVYNIIYNDNNNNKFYLTSHRFYLKEQLNENCTLISVVNKEYEGQKWIIKMKIPGLYTIKYFEKEYEMENWRINLYEDRNFKLNVILKKNKDSLFKLFIVGDNLFYIQDSLTDYFLFVDKNRIRDKNSFFVSITSDIEKASKFSFKKI